MVFCSKYDYDANVTYRPNHRLEQHDLDQCVTFWNYHVLEHISQQYNNHRGQLEKDNPVQDDN